MTALKPRRQRYVIQLLRRQPVTSQNQIVASLRALGLHATQATVSRDLDELGAIKVRRNGKVAYALPAETASAPAGDILRRMLAESVVGVVSTGNLVVIKTPPGHASMVAAAIDRADLQEIAGTIAGDDTVMVACRQGIAARRVERRLHSLADSMPLEPDGR